MGQALRPVGLRVGGEGQAFWARDVPCSLGLSLGRGQPAWGCGPFRWQQVPSPSVRRAQRAPLGLTLSTRSIFSLSLSLCITPWQEKIRFLYTSCVIADDQVLLVKHLGLNLQLALFFFSAPLTVSPGRPGMFLAGARPSERERRERVLQGLKLPLLLLINPAHPPAFCIVLGAPQQPCSPPSRVAA